ncbi:MAG: FtsX-like permease family protein [Actinobacteria bacterium]|nr:MAG: FtsX-like permease family protein [Actinomycetota bacterium]RIK05146.1 MAG: ABC transporter substrate-binding protein [Acidobacteriota bacterium]
MFRTTFKNLRARKRRLLTTALAVTIGVAFMAGTLVIADTISRTFDDLFADATEGIDAAVRGSQSIDVDFGPEARNPVPETLVAQIAELDGAAAVEGQVSGYAQFLDKDDEPVGNPGTGAPTLGFNWNEVPELNPFELTDGGPPSGAGEVVIDRGTARDGGFAVGDTIAVLTQAGRGDFTVTGIVTFGGQDRPAGATTALFETTTAQDLVGEPGTFQEIAVVAGEGVSEEDLVTQIQAIAPAGVEVLTGEQYTEDSQNQVQEGLSFFNTFLLVFAGIALFVGSFIIYNTFNILVAQRTGELGLLRALGASRRQVFGSVILEATIVGVIAGVIGLVLGIGLASLLKLAMAGLGIELPGGAPVVTVRTAITALATGMVITVLAALVPARRAGAVPPLVALRQRSVEDRALPRRRTIAGGVVTAIGLASLGYGLWGEPGNAIQFVGLGALVTFIGVALLAPVLASPFVKGVGGLIAKLRGTPAALAEKNALRNPRRTSATASALMIGVGLVGFITIFAASTKASIDKTIDDAFTGDLVVASGTFGFGGLPPEVADEIAALPEIDLVSGMRFGPARVDGEDTGVVAVNTDQMARLADIGISEGSADDFGVSSFGIHEDVAEEKGWELGTPVTIEFVDTGAQTFTVDVIYSENALAGPWFIDTAAFEANYAQQFDAQIYASLTEGASLAKARESVEEIVDPYPAAEVQDQEEYTEATAGQIDQLLGLVYLLLVFAVIIAVIGISNTLALSIYERTHELGLLRAVGMTRQQMRSSIRWESVMIALFGTILGLTVGLVFGWAVVSALADEGFSVFQAPVSQLVVIALLAALAGVIASLRPARRAAKLDMLEAIMTE